MNVRVPRPWMRLLAPLARRAESAGLPVYLVGGCVRDWLSGCWTRDIDLTAEGDAGLLAREAARIFGARVESFERFGTLRLFLPGGLRLDLARARAERYERPAALPEVRAASLGEDLGRRDFSINAMAARLTPRGAGEILDLHHGLEDLSRRRLRVLHSGSFQDDPTRIFRAARYAARLGFKLESSTAALLRRAVSEGAPGLLSRARVRQELLRVLDEDEPDGAMRLLRSWGLFPFLHPRLRWPPSRARGPVRLGLAALAMGPADGRDFIESLELERGTASGLLLALRVAERKASPRAQLPDLAREALALRYPGLPAAALRPLRLGGEDLKRLGLKEGSAYARWLDAAARAQWRGEFSKRSEALKWLRVRMSSPRKRV